MKEKYYNDILIKVIESIIKIIQHKKIFVVNIASYYNKFRPTMGPLAQLVRAADS